jgi:hypothetical protein
MGAVCAKRDATEALFPPEALPSAFLRAFAATPLAPQRSTTAFTSGAS